MRLMTLLATFALTAASQAQAADSAIVLHGEGVQIYTCTQAAGSYGWRLKAPEAMLADAAGDAWGRHFAGPSWQANDGSTIVGDPLVTSPAPQAGSIPWLVLTVKSHTGEGLFANVAYVVRSATVGGAAPASGCDEAHAGAETRVDYSATYTFFPKPN